MLSPCLRHLLTGSRSSGEVGWGREISPKGDLALPSLSSCIFFGAVEGWCWAAMAGPPAQGLLKPAHLGLWAWAVRISSKLHVREGTLVAGNQPWWEYLHHGNWRYLRNCPQPPPQSWYSFSSRSSRPRNRTRVACIAGGFFTNWAMREARPVFVKIGY